MIIIWHLMVLWWFNIIWQDLTTAGCSIIALPKGIQPSAWSLSCSGWLHRGITKNIIFLLSYISYMPLNHHFSWWISQSFTGISPKSWGETLRHVPAAKSCNLTASETMAGNLGPFSTMMLEMGRMANVHAKMTKKTSIKSFYSGFSWNFPPYGS